MKTFRDFESEIMKIEGMMHSYWQKEYMFDLGTKSQVAAEIGSWKGFSAAIVGTGMAQRETKGKYYCIDNFQASNNELVHEDTLPVFNKMVQDLKLEDIIVPVIGFSYNPEVLDQIPNNLDFIYIDGDHKSESVFQDTVLYAPKVKPDGFIIYHDYPDAIPETNGGVPEVLEGVQRAVNLGIVRFLKLYDNCAIFVH